MHTRSIVPVILGACLVMGVAPNAVTAPDTPRALPERAATLTPLGQRASALTYWVKQTDGAHVVTTIDTATADASHHTIVRFAAVLLPGQSQIVSVPASVGVVSPAIRISRNGDAIEVSRVGDEIAANN